MSGQLGASSLTGLRVARRGHARPHDDRARRGVRHGGGRHIGRRSRRREWRGARPLPHPAREMDAAAVGKRATLIPRITALDGHAGALALLHAAAWAVEPVQRSRGWAVGALLEFVPANPGLLVRAWWGRRRR